MNVERPSIRVHASCSIRGPIQERSPTYVTYVVKPSLRTLPLLNMVELTLGRNFLSVVSVKKLSASKHTLVNITGFTQERDLMNVWNVGNPSGTVQHLFDIRSFMLENKMGYNNQCGKTCMKTPFFSKFLGV